MSPLRTCTQPTNQCSHEKYWSGARWLLTTDQLDIFSFLSTFKQCQHSNSKETGVVQCQGNHGLPSLGNCKEVKCSEAYGLTRDHKISSKAYSTFAEK